MQLTAVIHRGENYFVALCPELEVVSQGESVEEAKRNLTEAVELFVETADKSELKSRLRLETYIAPLEVSVG